MTSRGYDRPSLQLRYLIALKNVHILCTHKSIFCINMMVTHSFTIILWYDAHTHSSLSLLLYYCHSVGAHHRQVGILNPPQSCILSTTNGHLRLGLVHLVRQARVVRAILIMARVERVDPRVLLQAMIIQMDGVIFRRGDHGLLHLLHQERVESQAAITVKVASQVAT